MKRNITALQTLSTGALTILALIGLMAPSAMAQIAGTVGGFPSTPGIGGTSTPTITHFDGDPINETLAQSLASDTLLDWSRCEDNGGGYLDDCIILHEYTASGTLAIRQLAAEACINPTNETCQQGHRIKFQTLVSINDTSSGGAYAFMSSLEVKKHAKVGIGRFSTHKLVPLSSGAMYYANNTLTVDFFDASDTWTEGYEAFFASEEGYKCTSCGTYTYNRINTVVAGVAATGHLLGDVTASPAARHMSKALADQATALGVVYLVTDEDMMSPVFSTCLQECGLTGVDVDVCDDIEEEESFEDVDGNGNILDDGGSNPLGNNDDDDDDDDDDDEEVEDDDAGSEDEGGDDQSGGGYDIGPDECDGSPDPILPVTYSSQPTITINSDGDVTIYWPNGTVEVIIGLSPLNPDL